MILILINQTCFFSSVLVETYPSKLSKSLHRIWHPREIGLKPQTANFSEQNPDVRDVLSGMAVGLSLFCFIKKKKSQAWVLQNSCNAPGLENDTRHLPPAKLTTRQMMLPNVYWISHISDGKNRFFLAEMSHMVCEMFEKNNLFQGKKRTLKERYIYRHMLMEIF